MLLQAAALALCVGSVGINADAGAKLIHGMWIVVEFGCEFAQGAASPIASERSNKLIHEPSDSSPPSTPYGDSCCAGPLATQDLAASFPSLFFSSLLRLLSLRSASHSGAVPCLISSPTPGENCGVGRWHHVRKPPQANAVLLLLANLDPGLRNVNVGHRWLGLLVRLEVCA